MTDISSESMDFLESVISTKIENAASRVSKSKHKAKVLSVDSDGTVWVTIPGMAERLPVMDKTVEVTPEEYVDLEIDNVAGTAIIVGNLTNPGLGVESPLDGEKLKYGTVAGDAIAENTITGRNIQDSTITGSKFEDGTITGSKIAESTITGSRLVDNTIEGSKIADSTITGSKIDASTFEDGQISGSAIDTSTFTNGSISGSAIDTSTFTNGSISGTAIDASTFTQGQISGSAIDSSTLTNIPYASIADADVEVAAIADAQIATATINQAQVANLTADLAAIGTAIAGKASVGDLEAAEAEITNLQADTAKIHNLTANQLSAATGYIGDLSAANISAQDIIADHTTVGNLDATYATIEDLTAAEADIANLQAGKADISVLESDYIDADTIEANYAQVDFSNVTASWISNGTIANAAITDAMINSVSANKLTAGTIDASKISVTNLQAENISVKKINGQTVSGKSVVDALAQHESDISDLDSKIDDEVEALNDRIDGAIESHTGSAVPTLQNTPASTWNTNDLKDEHVGDVYYVVNQSIPQNGYCYRFTKSDGNYSWQLIKDSDVTAALQRLQTAEGKITTIESFDSTVTSFMDNTDDELSSLKTRSTSLETRMSDAETDISNKVETSVFNSLSQTVDENSSSITTLNSTTQQLRTDVDGKASQSDVTTLTTTVNSVKQTADSNKSSITQLTTTTQTLREELDNMEIGGRNLLRWTRQPTASNKSWNILPEQTDGWSRWDSDWTFEDTVDGIKGTNNSGSPSGFAIPFVHENAVVGGEEYTLSFDYRTNMTTLGSIYLLVASGGNVATSSTSITSSTSAWQHYEQTLIWGSTSGKITRALLFPYYAYASGAWLEIKDCSMKLERGNKATDWSPAPEDVESDLETFKTTTTNKFNTVDQTLDGINTSIGNIQNTVSQKADGSTVNNLSSQVNTINETVSGHTQSIQSINSTVSTKADKSAAVSETTQLWFSKANTTAPSKPTSHVTSTSTGGNAWTTVVPAYSSSYPHYFYCYEWKFVDGTYGWSSIVHDEATCEAQERARTAITNASNAQTTANANIKSTVQLWFTKANETAPSKPTAHVITNNAATGNAWNLAVPTYNASYPKYFYCYEYQKGDGTYAWSDVVFDRATTENQYNSRAAQSSVSTLQQDYANFKQTVETFESTVGSTYATKEELSDVSDGAEVTKTQEGSEAKSTIVTDGAADLPLLTLEPVYGESVQDGTPTPDAPKRIWCVKSPNIIGVESTNIPNIVTSTREFSFRGWAVVLWTKTWLSSQLEIGKTYILSYKATCTAIPDSSYIYRENRPTPLTINMSFSKLKGTDTKTMVDNIGVTYEFVSRFTYNGTWGGTYEYYGIAGYTALYRKEGGGNAYATFKIEDLQLELADSTTTTDSKGYVPYNHLGLVSSTGSTAYLNLTDPSTGDPVELHGLDSTYRDILTIDASGHAVVEKRTYSETYTGGFGYYGDYLGYTLHYMDTNHYLVESSKGIVAPKSNRYVGSANYNYTVNNQIRTQANQETKRFYVYDSSYKSAQAFNAYLASNPLYVVLPLAERDWYTIDLGYVDLPEVTDGSTVYVAAEVQPVIGGTWWTPAGYSLGKFRGSYEERVSNQETSIQQTKAQVAIKANSSDVYTKTQTDGLITTEVNNRNAAITTKADEITTSVSSTYATKTELANVPGFKYIDSDYNNARAVIEGWAAEGLYIDYWSVRSNAGVRVGDTVYIKTMPSDNGGKPLYVVVTVSAVRSNNAIAGTSHGWIDNALGTRLTTAESKITQHDDEISLRATKTEVLGDLADYTPLEYLQSSGTQRIDTGYKRNGYPFRIDADVLWVSVPTAEYDWAGDYNGGGSNNGFVMGKASGSNAMYLWGASNWTAGGPIVANTRYSYSFSFPTNNSRRIFVDGVEYNNYNISNTGMPDTGVVNVGLFSGKGTAQYCAGSFRIYHAKIYNPDLVRDFVPVKRKSDSALGMYDLLSGTFYPNAGTGAFTAGPEVGWTTKTIDTSSASLSVQSGMISSRVERNGVISSINQSAEAVTIDANRVNIAGATIFTGNGRLSETSLNNAYDAKGAADEAVDNLEIGGTNLFLNTGASDWITRMSINWGSIGSATLAYTTDTDMPGFQVLSITRPNNTSQAGIYLYPYQHDTELKQLEANKVYTVSFYAKASTTGVVVFPQWIAEAQTVISSTASFEIATSWTRYSVTFIAKAVKQALCLYSQGTANATVKHAKFQLEHGSKLTDWQPAPEDMASKISAVSQTQRIYYQSNSTTLPPTPGTASSNWVTDETGNPNVWTKKRMSYSSTHPYIYTCEQKQVVSGTVSYTTVLLDDTTTVIDGGKIITGSVTANALNATDINGSGKLTIGAFNSDTQTSVLNSNIKVGGTNLLSWSNDLTKWNKESNVSVSWDSTKQMYKITYTGTNKSRYGIYQDLSVEPSTTYTLSATGDGDDMRIEIGVKSFANTVGWPDANLCYWAVGSNASRKSYTFTTGSDHNRARVYIGLHSTGGGNDVGYILRPQFEKGNLATDWEPAPEDIVSEEQYIYKQAVSGTNSMSVNTTWVTATGESTSSDTAGLTPVWTTKRPTYRSNYPVIFIAKQSKNGVGTVTCTTPVKDDTTTVIDGGHITTGTIDANRISSTVVNAINANVSDTINANKINVSQITIGQSQVDNLSAALASKSNKVLPDTRSTNQPPSWYFTNYPRQSITEFKQVSTIGLTGSSTYCSLVTIVPWGDSSGGWPRQSTNVAGKSYHRIATDANTWGAWKSDEETATTYITAINDNGIMVHAANNPTTNYQAITAEGSEIYKGGTSVAKFGESTRLGKKAAMHSVIDGDSFDLFTDSNDTKSIFHVGYPTGATITDTFVGNGTKKEYTLSQTPSGTVTVTLDGTSTSAWSPSPSGTTLTFTTAPGDGVVIAISYPTAAYIPYYTLGVRNGNIGKYSTVEGYETVASGEYSHAEGWYAKAIGGYSHAEGNYTNAYGYYSHAEGRRTEAKGSGSHAEGYNTKAKGEYSHSQNYYAIADGPYQTALGRSNASDENKLVIVGNGDYNPEYQGSTFRRHNALTIDWDGKVTTSPQPSSAVSIGTSSNNGVSSDTGIGMYTITDKNGEWAGRLASNADSSGNIITSIEAHNKKTDGTDVENYIKVTANKNGTQGYYVGSKPEFRKAIDAPGYVTANGYGGIASPDGTDTGWVRTPTSGLIPYAEGGNSSSLGSSTWPFKNIYGTNIYHNGTKLGTLAVKSSGSVSLSISENHGSASIDSDVAAGAAKTVNVTINMSSGYAFAGISDIRKSGTGATFLGISSWSVSVSGQTVTVAVQGRNYYSSKITANNVTVTVYIRTIKTSNSVTFS